MRKNMWLFLILFGGAIGLGGCTNLSELKSSMLNNSTPKNNQAQPSSATKVTNKVGDTTKTGMIIETNGNFFLQQTGQPPLAINSYAVNLADYVGRTVTVTGQYSGDELFIGQIES